MRTCSSCGIIIGSIQCSKSQLNMCKYCYKRYQAEQFKYWYDKQPKKDKHTKCCMICSEKFQSSQGKATVCSDKCRNIRKKYRERLRRKL